MVIGVCIDVFYLPRFFGNTNTHLQDTSYVDYINTHKKKKKLKKYK